MLTQAALVRREVTGTSRNVHKARLANLVERAITKANPDPKFTHISQNIKNDMRSIYGQNLSDENIRKVIWYMSEKAHGKSPNKWRKLNWKTIITSLVMNYPVFARRRRT
jgi:hypothetical protein